jgi:hypothetical protein
MSVGGGGTERGCDPHGFGHTNRRWMEGCRGVWPGRKQMLLFPITSMGFFLAAE